LLFIPIIAYLFYKNQKNGIHFKYIYDINKTFSHINYKFYFKIIILILILINFIAIFGNPNKTNISQKIKKNGIDIVIALDISGSMEAEDLKPNRLESAKNVIKNFIENLSTDRV
jgi:Ca-activated chloride channel family protein